MMQKLRKPVSIILVFMMIVSLFTVVPITASAAEEETSTVTWGNNILNNGTGGMSSGGVTLTTQQAKTRVGDCFYNGRGSATFTAPEGSVFTKIELKNCEYVSSLNFPGASTAQSGGYWKESMWDDEDPEWVPYYTVTWTGESSEVTFSGAIYSIQSIVFTLKSVPAPTTFTVTWKNGDTTLETDTDVAEGATPTYDGATPEKASDNYYDYTFSGWSDGTNTYAADALPAVSGDVTYTAQFTETAKTFKAYVKKLTGGTYTIENLTGETTVAQLKEIIADQIDIPVTAQQRLIFAGKQIEDAKTLAEYNIGNESTIHLIIRGYTVTWLNYDNSELGTTTVQYGATPSYDGETPTKPEDENNTYTFAGWSPEITAVTGDVTYTAQFDANPKSGSFDGLNWSIDEDGVLTFSGSGAIPAEAFKFNPFIKKVIINDSVTKVGANAFADCTNLTELTFDSETPISFANGEYTYLTDTVTVNVPAGSTYQYTVQVSTLATEKTAYKDVLPTLQAEFKKEVAWGTNYEEALAIVLENYADWVQQQTGEYPIADEFEFVLEDEERTGNIADGQKYASVFGGANVHTFVLSYTVTWKNGETVLETDENVAQGTIPEYNGTTPEKDEDDDFTYTFAGWSPEVTAVTGDVEYTATFNATAKYEAGYYVVGTMNNWAIDPAYKLAENPATEGEYMLNDLALTASDEIKIIYAEPGEGKKWYPEGMDNNMSFSTDGSYNIYFRPDGQGGDDWYNGLIFAKRNAPAESTAVIDLINALPTDVTLADAEQIEAARAAYEALTDEQKDYIDTDTLNKLTDAEAALFGLKYDAFGEYRSNQADNFYIAMDQKIGTDDDELRNALNDAISAIENVSYDPNKSLDENKAAADAVVQAQTEVMNNKITEVCNAYKAQKIAQVQGLAQDGDPDPVYMEIEIIADRINGEMYEDTTVSSFKSRIDYHVEQAQEQISFAREQAFGNYKIDKAYDVRSLTQAGDSEAVLQIIDNAVQAINAVSYDTSKTYVENKAAVDAAADITLLEQQLTAQRNAEKAAAVTAQINALPADVTVNDKDQIEAARAAYDALTDDQKALVTNETLDKLTDAEEAFAKARDDKAAADTVIDQINALPADITLADAEQINAARNAYEALTDDQKDLIDSETLNKLTDAETALTEAVDQDAADAVDDKIDSLPAEITLDDKADVEAARAAFDALSDDQKALIDDETIAKLTAAEQTIANIEAANAVTDQINALPAEITLDNKASVEAARQVYDALTDDQKNLIDSETLNKLTAAETVIADREAAKAVEDQINALPDQITPENKQTFMDVSSAFIRLSHDQEEYLSEDAMNKVNNVLLANYFVTGADQLPEEITLDDKQSVADLRSYYDDANDDVKALISDEYMNKLVSAEQKIADLEAVKDVEDMISALPAVEDITLADKDAVQAANEAFVALTNEQVMMLDGDLFDKLRDAAEKIADLEAAKDVEDEIKALPDVILLEDKADVEAARAAYDALEPEQKDLIDLSVVEKLEAAEEVIADREAAKDVEDMINALPDDITLADKAAVDAADEARLNLTPAQADYLTFSAIDKLFKAQDKIRDLEAAKDVDDVIDALPEVDDITLDDKDAVEAARDFYDGLDDAAKALVGDDILDKLEAAEKKIADLQAAADVEEMVSELPEKDDVTVADTADIIAARTAYNALTDEQKAMVDKDTLDKLTAAETAVINALTDAFAAAQISTQINKLPETVVAGDKDDIEAARAAYDALTDAQKALVDDETMQKLLDAEEALVQALEDKKAADEVSEQINALPDELDVENKDDIEAAKAAYEALTDAQKAYVDEATMQKLTDAEAFLDSLVMLGDFDGDGEVTIIDVTLMQRYDVLLREYSEKQFKAADVDGDGDVTVIDVTFIQRYLSNIPVRFPIGEYVA